MLNADPELYDIVFVANATAGIKLVVEGFCGSPNGFRFTFLRDAHTSLVGVKGLAKEFACLSEDEVVEWLREPGDGNRPGLFAYPAQSNFNGRRFPLEWVTQLREHPGWYSLLDAASYLTTTPLDYSTVAPDFTVLSFYKIFGFPDLGAIIVRRDAGHILFQRGYFGGGTRAAMTADAYHVARKEIHEALEDGTLPFHSILALDAAINNYARLFGSHINVSRHAAVVSGLMHTLLSSLRHDNGKFVCQLFSTPGHGPIVAFNLLNANGSQIGFATFEKVSSTRNFALRTGGLCNPGGVQKYLGIENWEIERNYGRGRICGNDVDIIEGKNTGVIRMSFGACSTVEDVCTFVDFLREVYVVKRKDISAKESKHLGCHDLAVLIVDPIKFDELKPATTSWLRSRWIKVRSGRLRGVVGDN
jgi:molybdenum cofactor sulfurtransferase